MSDEPHFTHRFPPDDRSRVIGTLATREREEQTQQLARVSEGIAWEIVAFMAARVGQDFYAEELREHVESRCGKTAPGSADRVMRDCRQKGLISYRCVSRSRSLYRIESVRPKGRI